MPCLADDRAAVTSAVRALECDPRLLGADVLDPNTGPTGTFSLDLTFAAEAGGCPPAAQRELAARELNVREVAPEGVCWRVVVTA